VPAAGLARCINVWRCCRPGFTLIELLLVLVILGTLSGIAAPYLQKARERAQTARAIGDIRALQIDIATYEATNGEPPNSLADIDRDGLLDPWGHPYEYLKLATRGGGSGGGGRGAGGGGGGGGGGVGQARKDRFLVPINSDYDLYSLGPDGRSSPPLTAHASRDDVIRANDGGYIGIAEGF
jgi:general secretion pathway protein G